ncbi:MAG: metabolite traffic protein EboE [Ferruginibacter sp.]|nr:metabolite traffic protein EboE [Cytophagales bacterium]
MLLPVGYHLTYCTNIHAGETWAAVRDNLHRYLPAIKANLSPDGPFGVGLRLSNLASTELLAGDHLAEFKAWLGDHGLYVALLNGFPYGDFHRQVVKDDVHRPDWTTPERAAYTKRLVRILAELLPDGMDGGISTSPLSYKPWFGPDRERVKLAFRSSTLHLAEVVEELIRVKADTGKLIHLDLEPEPDGLIENTAELIDYFGHWLLPTGRRYLSDRLGIELVEADQAIKNHVRVCYDVCHFALAYEAPQTVFDQLEAQGIGIGRIQVSAAMKTQLPASHEERRAIADQFAPFVESTYLHQVGEMDADGHLTRYPDLPPALAHLYKPEAREWRTHFHVPVFLKEYGRLQSTQDEIIDVLRIARHHRVTQHLEVETYTWEVLPPDLKLDIVASITRELAWVVERMK